MADVADLAKEADDRFQAAALARYRAQAATPPGPALSADECHECGEPIPEGRRLAVPKTRHCAFCAGELERKSR